ncbi:hypothetical protein PFISCL1PPCAC_14772, partial [Pristionchus fissidentatus]
NPPPPPLIFPKAQHLIDNSVDNPKIDQSIKQIDQYIRSVSLGLIEHISNELRCMKCFDIFTYDNPPFITSCGHFYHNGCAEAEIDSSTMKNKCCKSSAVKPVNQGLTELGDLLTEHVALKEIYRILEQEDGYRCGPCGKLHPRWNAVRCVFCSPGLNRLYICVWCANKETGHSDHTFR